MLTLERSKVYKKDIRKQTFSNQHYAKYILYLGYLIDEKVLPIEARGHALAGQWSGYREFHISGDLLIIYKIVDQVLFLVRIGSHSELFSKSK